MKPINLFYEEPDPDRWIKFDRYPRKIIRRIVRGKTRPGGVMTIAINLMKGLERIGIPYRFNDYRYIKKHPEEVACIIGKPHVLFNRRWDNPIIFGAGIFSHPVDCPDLLEKYPNVKKILVPGNWMKQMFDPYYGDKVQIWPTGIDTNYWKPDEQSKKTDFLIYDKPLWGAEKSPEYILNTVTNSLQAKGLTYSYIKYGNYNPTQLLSELSNAKGCIFLSRHETQGLAYQQILSTNTPILAFDPGGFWPDTSYYPHKVQFQPVSSVPYWDNRCGAKFTGASDFDQALDKFRSNLSHFKPRDFIIKNLSLEVCANKYLDILKEVESQLN